MLQSRPANIEGHGEVTLLDLTRMALRMDPDRLPYDLRIRPILQARDANAVRSVPQIGYARKVEAADGGGASFTLSFPTHRDHT